MPGDYYVEFNIPLGYLFSPQDQGGDNAIDSDADTTTGKTTETTLDSGENDTTWDAGMYQPQKQPYAVGGEVYSVNRLIVLAPWIILAAAIIVGGIMLTRCRAHS
ncbi:SdrD B-like domain-containing protein [Chloroflexota bacterium]